MDIRRKLFILFLLLLFSFTGVSAQERNFVLSSYRTESTFNPLHSFYASEAQVYSALYEGLVTYHPFTLEPIPGIAKSWEILEDGKIYLFHIRPSARYSNGDYITAQHIKDTWLTLLKPDRKAEYSFLLDVIKGAQDYRTGRNPDPESVAIRVISESTLEVELDHPANYFLKVLCHHSFVPLHPTLLEYRDFKEAPEHLGNGPFYLFSYSQEEMVLKKNPLYWDSEKVFLDSITVTYIADPQVITERFNKGEIHWAASDILWNQVENPEAILMNQLFATSYFFFNSSREPWNNPKVRRALALLVPWEDLRSEEFIFIPTSTLVPRVSGYPKVSGIASADRDAAYILLAEAGYPLGEGLKEIVILIPESEESKRQASIMKSAWEQNLSCTVVVETASAETYYDRLKDPVYTLATLTWIGDFADPLTFLQMWTSGSNLNDAGYKDSHYDDLINRSMGETDEERYALLGEAEEYLLHQGTVLPVNHSPAFNCLDLSKIEGWFPNPLDIHPFKWIRFVKPELLPGITQVIPKKHPVKGEAYPPARHSVVHRGTPSP